MPFFVLEPEVAGGWGRNTVADTRTHPPAVNHLHYEFYGWLGDALLESFPCFLVSEPLGEGLENVGLSGFRLAGVEVTNADQFHADGGSQALPTFRWLQVVGQPGRDDFG